MTDAPKKPLKQPTFLEGLIGSAIPLALAILQKKPVQSSVFVKHELITPKNVGLIYPVQTE